MPLKNGRFSVQETKFVDAYVGTRDVQKAAKIAGYAHVDHGYQVLRKPAVLQAIQELSSARLVSEVEVLAINTIVGVMQDATSSTRDKLAAAALGLKHSRPLALEAGQVKDISEMSSAELQLLTATLRQEAAEREARAKVIDLDPAESAQVAPNLFD